MLHYRTDDVGTEFRAMARSGTWEVPVVEIGTWPALEQPKRIALKVVHSAFAKFVDI
jgi:hypothetical protein